MAQEAIDNLDHNEAPVQGHADGKSAPEIRRGVVVAVAGAVGVVFAVMMLVAQ
jgi:hypothetical protein